MIGLLEGRSLDIQEKTVILSVDGVGYELSVTTEARLICEHTSTNHETVQLRVHTHVREDQFSLFGFDSLRERELFRLLISVSGIGPKSALEILSAPSSEVIRALAEQDAAFLISCPGIDKKLPNVWSPSRGGARSPHGILRAKAPPHRVFAVQVAWRKIMPTSSTRCCAWATINGACFLCSRALSKSRAVRSPRRRKPFVSVLLISNLLCEFFLFSF